MLGDEPDGLFGDPRPATPPQPAPDATPDWLVAKLRSALDALNLQSMDDRQAVIVELAGRPVASLRDLSSAEARRILEGLHERATSNRDRARRDSWDDREGDTWIDRL